MEFLLWTCLSFLALYPISMGAIHYVSHRKPDLPFIGVHVSYHHRVHTSNFAPEQRIQYALRPWLAEQVFTPLAALGLCCLAPGAVYVLDASLVDLPGFISGLVFAHCIGVYLGDQYHRPRSPLERFAWYRRAVARHLEHHEACGRLNFEIVPWGEPYHWCVQRLALFASRTLQNDPKFVR
jgi:hypothetical protein